MAWPPASWPSTTRATAWSGRPPKPSASAWATTAMPPTPTSGRRPSTRSPSGSRDSASSHPRRASCAARVTTSSGACSTTSVAGSSLPSATAPWPARSGRSGRAAATAATTRSISAPPRSSRGPAGSPPTTPWPTAASRTVRTDDASGPSGSCKAASGDVRNGKGGRLYPAEDRWIGLVVSKARPIGEPDDGVDPGDSDGGTPDLPDVTELLEVIADTAGELEDHIDGLTTSLEALRPYLPVASASESEPVAGVTA